MKYEMPDQVNCFHCMNAEVDPGDPGCYTMSNGDPGWPSTPPEVMCGFIDPDSDMDLMMEIASLRGIPDYVIENAAKFCPLFKTKCAECGDIITDPAIALIAYEWDESVVCSQICKEKRERLRRFNPAGFWEHTDNPFEDDGWAW